MEEIKLNGLNETIYIYKTKVGLPIYMWVNKNISSMYASLSVNFGSIYTEFKVGNNVYEVPNGTAHYLEHVKFNISDNETAHDRFIKVGGENNAFTTFNYTSYLVFATQNKQENLNILLDYVYNPYFTKSKINKERGIIEGEAGMGEDDAFTVSFFESLKNTFKNSKYRNLITGTKDEVDSITIDDIKLSYDMFYHPENMFLVLTGNFDPYEMAKLVDDNLNKKEFKLYQYPRRIDIKEPKKVNKEYSLNKINITYPLLKYIIKIPRKIYKDIDNVKLKIIWNLILNINFGPTSLFQDDLKNKNLINSLYYATDFYDDYLLVSINIETMYPEEILKLLKAKIENITIDEADLNRKRNAAIATLITGYEDVEEVNMRIQDEIINYGGIINNLKDIFESIDINDLNNVFDSTKLDNVSINIFEPKENQD